LEFEGKKDKSMQKETSKTWSLL